MFRRALVTTCLVTGLVAASFGTAQAATVSPGSWAADFCTAVDTWQQDSTVKVDDLNAQLEGVTDLTTGRDTIVDLLGDLVDSTDTAVDAIKDAGAPSTPNGAKISAAFVTGFKAVSKQFAKSQQQAEKLSTTSPAEFATKGKQIGTELSNSGERLNDGFSAVDKLDKGKKLEKAVKAAPECAFLNT
jgi:hypothetical protein